MRKNRWKNPSQRSRNFFESGFRNERAVQYYVDDLTQLSMSMFQWKNLPDTIDERFLELTLFGDGMCVFFKDEVMGYLSLQTMIGGALDVYRIPKMRRAYAQNGYNNELDESNSVIIFNNLIHTPAYDTVLMFAEKLANYDRIIDVNTNAQKTPILIECDESERLTMQNVYQQYDGNAPVIYGRKGISGNVNILTTGAPFVAAEVYDLKMKTWNEALTYLGIANVNMTKKERMVSDEVVRAMGGAIANRNSRLKARKQACEKINEMFDLDIDVEFNETIENGGVEDGSLYDRSEDDMREHDAFETDK